MDNDNSFFETHGYRILLALRRIIRAVDIHSRRLNDEFKITSPQMICICSLSKKPSMTLSELATDVNLSISTVNGIVDRLENKGLLTRTRSTQDRRKVVIKLTDEGNEILKRAPSLLQERFSQSLKELSALEQATLTIALERIVEMMGAENIDASPNLISDAAFNDIDYEEQK